MKGFAGDSTSIVEESKSDTQKYEDLPCSLQNPSKFASYQSKPSSSQRKKRLASFLDKSESESEVEFLCKRAAPKDCDHYASEKEFEQVVEHQVEDVLGFYNFEFEKSREELERIFLGVEYLEPSQEDLENYNRALRNKRDKVLQVLKKKSKKCEKLEPKKKNILTVQLTRQFKEDSKKIKTELA